MGSKSPSHAGKAASRDFRLPFPGVAELRQLGQREEDDYFAGRSADVVVQAQNLHPRDFLNHALHLPAGRSRRGGNGPV
jgi:hypothetical protein